MAFSLWVMFLWFIDAKSCGQALVVDVVVVVVPCCFSSFMVSSAEFVLF